MAFRCTSCGYRSVKWLGRCPNCGEWDTFVEEKEEAEAGEPGTWIGEALRPITEIDLTEAKR
ncbi:DNA repair protein RadA, partial [bacterium]